MAIGKAEILAAQDRPTERVNVPEWGGEVIVRTLSGAERDAYEDETLKTDGKSLVVNRKNARARLVARCLCDESGNRLFSDAEAVALGSKSAAVLDRLFGIAQRLNGMTPKDEAALLGNSDADRSA